MNKKFRKWLLDLGLTENSINKSDLKELKAEYEADMKIIAELPKTLQFEVEGKIECSAPEGEGGLPTFKIVAYTGKPIMQGFGEVIVDIQGMDISKQIPILWHHDSKSPVGHSTSIEKVEGVGVVIEGVVSGDPKDPIVSKFLTMSENGFPFQASIGAPIKKATRVSAGKTATINGIEVKAGMIIAQVTELVETSVLPIGADRNTNTKVSATGGDDFENPKIGKLKKMKKFDKWLIAKGFSDVESLEESVVASLQKMYDAELEIKANGDVENEKIAQLETKLGEMTRIESIKAEGGEHATIIATAIDNGWSAEQVKASVVEIEKIRAERNAPSIHIKGNLATTDGAVEASMATAMGLRTETIKAGLSDEDMDSGSSLKDMGFLKGAEVLLIANGNYSVGMSNEEMLRLAFSTTSLPVILSNVANKSLMDEYNYNASNVGLVSQRMNVKDFKKVTWTNIYKDLTLKEIGADGAMKQGSVSETEYNFSIDQFAREFSVDRKMIINDDLNALQRVFAGFGRGASVAEQRDFWKTFVDDGGSFYTGTLQNKVLSIDALTDMFAVLRENTDENGDPISVTGTTLIVPPRLETFANQLAKDLTVNETTAVGKAKPASNPHAGKFSVVVEPYLNSANVTGGSPTAFYLQANNRDVTSFVNLRLASQQEPVIRQEQLGVGKLGIATDCVFDFGSSQIDNKGIVKSDGTV